MEAKILAAVGGQSITEADVEQFLSALGQRGDAYRTPEGKAVIVEELIKREPRPAPKLWIDPEIKDFYDFTPDSLKLVDYDPHPFDEKIEVAV